MQIFCTLAIAAKRASVTIVSAADLQADYTIFHAAFSALHPGLLRYNTAGQIAQHFTTLNQALSHAQSLPDAFLRYFEFVARVHCAHSYLNCTNQPAAVAAQVFSTTSVPFQFRWIDRQMIVTRNATELAPLVPGTHILAIDGHVVTDMLVRLLPIARANGANDAKRIDMQQVQGADPIETFDVYYPLYFPSQHSTTLRFIPPGKTRVQIAALARIAPVERERRLASTMPAALPDQPAWRTDFRVDGVAVLTMPSWAFLIANATGRRKADLSMTFGKLASAQVKHLIIDLRANEGGLSVGNEIIAQLVEQDIPLQQAVKKVRYRRVAEALAPFLDTWDPSFKDWGEPASSNGDGAYRLDSAATDDTVIHPQAPHIGWMVSVLVGARNSSAIFEFAQLIRHQRRGRLIGQPTGGNQRGINGGAFFFLRLPHTGIEVDLPIIGVFPLQP